MKCLKAVAQENTLPLNSHNKNQFGLSRDEKTPLSFGLSLSSDFITFGRAVLGDVGLSTFEDNSSLGFVILFNADKRIKKNHRLTWIRS